MNNTLSYKILALSLVFVLLVSVFTACSKKPNENVANGNQIASNSSQNNSTADEQVGELNSVANGDSKAEATEQNELNSTSATNSGTLSTTLANSVITSTTKQNSNVTTTKPSGNTKPVSTTKPNSNNILTINGITVYLDDVIYEDGVKYYRWESKTQHSGGYMSEADLNKLKNPNQTTSPTTNVTWHQFTYEEVMECVAEAEKYAISKGFTIDKSKTVYNSGYRMGADTNNCTSRASFQKYLYDLIDDRYNGVIREFGEFVGGSINIYVEGPNELLRWTSVTTNFDGTPRYVAFVCI